MHDAVQRGVGLGDLGFLVRRQADRLGKRINRHPVIGRRLEAPLAPAHRVGILSERGNRETSEQQGDSDRVAHNE